MELSCACEVSELVMRRAGQAMEARMDGVVMSPLEVASVRALVGPDPILVTPGVRSTGAGCGDQYGWRIHPTPCATAPITL